MNAKKTTADYVERRATLLAELLLEDLGAFTIAKQSTAEVEIDYLVGFKNVAGGVNTIAVVLKAIEQPVDSPFAVNKRIAAQIVNSNLPVMLLVVDTKHNQYWYSWGAELVNQLRGPRSTDKSTVVLVPLTEPEQKSLRTELVRAVRAAS